jgi:mannose-1-phosphate guanylyltransferase
VKAIVLAGGQGTRLKPLTNSRHKSLVPVLNRPLLEHVLDWLASNGIDEAILAIGGHNTDLAEAFPVGARRQVAISHSVEPEPLGSGGAIRLAAANLHSTFLVLNGDVVTGMDLGAMHSAHRRHGAAVSINLYAVEDPWHYGVAVRGADGFIEQFVEKPTPGSEPSRLVNAGAWLFEPEALKDMPPGAVRVEETLFPALAESHRLYGHVFEGLWVDVGNPGRYLGLNLELLDRGQGNAADRGEIAGSAQTEGASVRRSVVGPWCVVAAGARVEDSVLWDSVRVGAGAEVTRSVLASGAVVGEGARLLGAVLGGGAVVPPRAEIAGSLLAQRP